MPPATTDAPAMPPTATTDAAATSHAASGYPLPQLESSAPPPVGTPARILADAQDAAERIRELARSEGHAEGLAQGRDDALAEARSGAQALHQALSEAHHLREQMLDETERDALALALALAAKILAGALDVQPERVLDAVRGALRRVTERRRVTVLVDPADLHIVSAAIDELTAQTGGIELCEVHADRRVGPGGAIVRTAESEIDATIQTQLERAREVVHAELAGAQDAP
ncbi:MAG TPA: FliH/SctL family protein [Solirubrobacteraceae bacterium]|jgi:flagellar assembly protein FliH|nr:FliH/SctL family protein [Solirubrobacteraceae bacterium]